MSKNHWVVCGGGGNPTHWDWLQNLNVTKLSRMGIKNSHGRDSPSGPVAKSPCSWGRGAWVASLVREINPACRNWRSCQDLAQPNEYMLKKKTAHGIYSHAGCNRSYKRCPSVGSQTQLSDWTELNWVWGWEREPGWSELRRTREVSWSRQ